MYGAEFSSVTVARKLMVTAVHQLDSRALIESETGAGNRYQLVCAYLSCNVRLSIAVVLCTDQKPFKAQTVLSL